MRNATSSILACAVLALAVTVLALVPVAAQAIAVTEYDVTIEGQATYARTDSYPAAYGPWQQSERAAFEWSTRFPSVTFYDKDVRVTSQVPETTVSEIDAELQASIPTPEGVLTGICTGTTLASPPSFGWLGDSVIPTPDPNVESIDVRVLGGVSFHLPSCSGVFGGGGAQTLGVGSTDMEIPWGPFDHAFDMPHEAVGMGKVIQLLDNTVSGSSCPGHGTYTASCVLSWKATVTFVRTAHWRTDLEESDIPVPPARPTPPAGPPDSVLDDLEIPMPKRARLTPGAGRARLTLTCPVACAGTATAYPAARRRGAGVRPLARARFKAAARRPTTVVLRFAPGARRKIRRAGGVRVDLRAVPTSGGSTARRSVAIDLPGRQRQRSS